MSGTPEIKPALTAPEEESIGPRDLTHWRSRMGRSLAGLVNRLVGAYARWTLAVTAALGLLAAVVTTLLANAAVRPRGGTVVDTPSAAAMEEAALRLLPEHDVLLMAAAVADYRPRVALDGKRPREGTWTLELEPTADILAGLARGRRPGQVLVGFAAETADGVERARQKRVRKGVDLIVLNDVSRPDIGFDVDDNEVVLVAADGEEHVAKAAKAVVAGAILDRVERLLGS